MKEQMRNFLSIILSLFSLCRASATPNPNTGIIDLSYHPHLDPKEITSIFRTSLHNFLSHNAASKEESRNTVLIDASASHLGDDIATVLDSLAVCDKGVEPSSILISFEARMNAVSPTGASALFDKIISMNKDAQNVSEKNEVRDAKDDTADTSTTAILENETVDVDEDTNATDEQSQEIKPTIARHEIFVEKLDIGFNDIGHNRGDKKATKQLHKALSVLIENESGCCPYDLRMDACGLGAPICRIIGKGLIDRQKHNHAESHQTLRNLYLGENNGIGDSGTAALAAALKLGRNKKTSDLVLNTLDLSSCGVGDAGAEALAMAIESNPGCVSNLDLSNNLITDDGAIALANGLIAGCKDSKKTSIHSLDLSNNAEIGDDGALALFEAVECGALCQLSLRSCSIKWRGFGGFGASIGRMLSKKENSFELPTAIEIDLSGNLLGKKEKKKKGGLSSAVSTNMVNSMNFIGKRLKSGLKEVGLNSIVGSSLESDDEAELMDSIGSEFTEDQPSSSRCGACEFYDSLSEDLETESKRKFDSKVKIVLGMRMCNFDEGGIAALGAASVLLGESSRAQFCVDCSMNGGVCDDQNLLSALAAGNHMDEEVENIAQTHLDGMDRFGYDGYNEEQYDNYDDDYN